MAGYLRRHRVEVLDATPTQIRALLLAGQGSALEPLRVLILGGEAIDESLWSALRDLRGVRVFNLYGPTECTVDVAVASVHEHSAPVIGREWPGCQILLLDPDLRPVPEGAAGEIYVTGAFLARGYLHPTRAERDRFTDIRLPGRDAAVRAYRTGDRARRNPLGLLEFLGRVDDQVKIRGHRVELAEVEAVLRECPGVRDARVGFTADNPANPLRAWLVADPTTDPAGIRRWLAGLLPDHMLPVLVPVARIPLGDTGKADLRTLLALPLPEHDGAADSDPGAVLHSVWREVLDVRAVRAGDNFFELGGDSLAATRMTLRTREETGRRIPVRLIFDHPVFRDYCLTVDGCAR
jgi:acyl-coenzyme A synthetase/AMP-(fatty) acid ligase